MRTPALTLLLSGLACGAASAFDPGAADRYPSPDLYRPNVDKLIINGPGSTGDVSDTRAAPAFPGAISQPLRDLFGEIVTVTRTGAKADGGDDTQAIQRALASGKEVVFPARPGLARTVYWTTGLTLPAGATLRCETRTAVAIKLLPGSDRTVLTGEGYARHVAAANAAGPGAGPNAGADNVTVKGCTIDGNRSAQTATGDARDSVNGIDIYGAHPVLEDVTFVDILGHGMRTNYNGYLGPDSGVEGRYESVRFARIGRNCWINNGPSDAQVKDMMQQDCGDEADDTYVGTYHGTNSSLRAFNYHGYHSYGQANRVRYNVSLNGGSQYMASHFEGGRGAIETRAGIPDQIAGSYIYAPFGREGACQVSLKGSSAIFVGNSFGGHQTVGISAVCFGAPGLPTGNNILMANSFGEYARLSPFNFVNDGGGNVIQGVGFASSEGAGGFAGRINPATSIDYDQGGAAAIHVHRRAYQVTTSFGLKAAGATQASAYAIAAQVNTFTAVPAHSGARLPAGGSTVLAGSMFTVLNRGQTDLRVYPPSGAIIDGAGFDAPVSIPAGGSAQFMFESGGQWRRL